MPTRPLTTDRRDFLKTSALLGAGYFVGGSAAQDDPASPANKLRFASIGVGGKGYSDMNNAAAHGTMVAICDTDDSKLDAAAARYADAKRFHDFREMLAELGDGIDAVTVSTPDHTHAPAAAMAMRMGKHVYCQKPLTHTILEARTLGELAAENGVATQMGNQGTALNGLREGVEVVRSGAIGTPKEVHVWTNRPGQYWVQGVPKPESKPAPDGIHWDLYCGPTPLIDFSPVYHPMKWRGYWQFGTGALGDMACHTMNMVYWALKLRNPVSVEAETSGHNEVSYPKWSRIRYEFAADGDRPALSLFWYDGGQTPPADLLMGEKMVDSGSLIVGDKGRLYSPNDYGAEFVLLPKKDFAGYKAPEPTIPRASQSGEKGHVQEWIDAIKGGPTPTSNFTDYAGPLTETVLLGNLAVWSGQKIDWDSAAMKAKGMPELDAIIRPDYRDGWEL